jgi:asparagine synthase (glutamine-hydrolysing)
MCGIAGYLTTDGTPADRRTVSMMGEAVSHRGPDGRGVFVDGPCGLAHRRLAIIDLTEAASQPMESADRRYVITYNGEVYNYKQIRKRLADDGVVFRSGSDTEVVLEAFARWGEDSISRLNGMFAAAIWDRRERKLTLFRDRYGVKPLYWTHQGAVVAFGSEQKAILAMPGIGRDIDLEAMLEYLTFQNIFTDRTLIDGIRMLPAGCLAVVDATGCCRVRRWWDFRFQEEASDRSDGDWAEELDALVTQAVQRQLVSDVDVGAFLSGGMDSGAIVGIAAARLPQMRTFTCGFDLSSASGVELNFDERRAAEALSYRFGTEHYEMVLKAGDMQRCMPSVVRALEEPRVGQSYPNWYVSRLASKFNRVVLAGTGGDELFGGYPWRYLRVAGSRDFEHFVDDYYLYWQRLLPNASLRRLFAPVASRTSHVWTRDIFRDVFSERPSTLNRPEDYVNLSLHLEAKTFLHGLLTVEDKLGMSHGLETRFPFLDNDLVDFAMRMPVRLKVRNLGPAERIDENRAGSKPAQYFQRTADGKTLLRSVMARYIPREVVEREKQGFSAPDASWFRGESMEYVRTALLSGDCRLARILDAAVIRELLEDHLEGRHNRRLLIWSFLHLEEWLLQHEVASGSKRQGEVGHVGE